MRAGGVGGRVTAAVALWAVVLVGVRITVLPPERCPDVTTADVDAAVEATVGWFRVNQRPDGTWLYRYDRAEDENLGGYNVVRHAGVTMSLYQAASHEVDDALAVADAGAEWALDHLVVGDGWQAFEPGSGQVSSGASALLVAGLAERRAHTGDHSHDDDLRDLGRFLEVMVEPSGAVLASWDPSTGAPVPGTYSRFYTGEAFWALTLLERELPGEGWGELAARVGWYIATERDEAEGYEPDVADHWAAYGFEVMVDDLGVELADEEAAYLRRQAGLIGVQVRYESQRVDTAPQWWIRGRRTLGAGLGTLGEKLGNMSQITRADERLAELATDVDDRARCVAGMLVDRQAQADDGPWAEPARVDGAWFQFDITQMDDQQHSMSALLLTRPLLEAGGTNEEDPE